MYEDLIKAIRETDFGDRCVMCEHEDMCRNKDCIILQAADAIEELGAADVRPVVLCRDCIHLSKVTNSGTFFRCDRYDKWQDENNRVYMPLDGFCSYGHKKEEI